MRRLALACAVLVVVACRKNPTPEEQEAESKKYFETRVGDVKFRGAGFAIAPTPVPPPASAPGPAFLYMTDVGVLKIEVTGESSLIGAKLGSVSEMVATPTGDLYAIAGSGVWKLPAGSTELTNIGEGTSHRKLALAPDGAIWAAGHGEVGTWTGSAWKTVPGKPYLDDKQFVRSLVIDGANKPYLSTARTIMVFDGTAWKPVWDIRELYVDGMYPMPESPQLMIGPAGTLVVGNGRGTLTFDGKDLKFALRPTDATYLGGRYALHGTDLVAMSKERIVRTPLAGGPDNVTMPGPQAPFSYDATLDNAGRVWMKLESGGFTVVDVAGTATFIPPGGLPDLITEIEAIAVAGAGPTTLPTVVEVAKGSIRAVIQRAGAPIAKAKVEVCRRVASKFEKGDSPCRYSTGRARGETDATGAFQIDDLPLLDYGVAVEVDDQWYGIQGKACGEGLAPGAVCDLGALDIGGD